MKRFKDYVTEQLAEAKGASLTQSQKAIRFAAKAHRKQTRTDSKSYITHPVEVSSCKMALDSDNPLN